MRENLALVMAASMLAATGCGGDGDDGGDTCPSDPLAVGVGGCLDNVDPSVDTDMDGIPDVMEGTQDANGNMFPAHRDPAEMGVTGGTTGSSTTTGGTTTGGTTTGGTTTGGTTTGGASTVACGTATCSGLSFSAQFSAQPCCKDAATGTCGFDASLLDPSLACATQAEVIAQLTGGDGGVTTGGSTGTTTGGVTNGDGGAGDGGAGDLCETIIGMVDAQLGGLGLASACCDNGTCGAVTPLSGGQCDTDTVSMLAASVAPGQDTIPCSATAP